MLNIFNLKKHQIKIFSFKSKGNNVGNTKHYPFPNREWVNSIYAFNKNSIKILPNVDKLVLNLITSYFNMFSIRLEKNIRTRKLRLSMRRLGTKRILISKPLLKHTNNEVNITIYIFNRQKSYYMEQIASLNDFINFNKIKVLNKIVYIKKCITNYINIIEQEKILMFNSLDIKKSLFPNFSYTNKKFLLNSKIKSFLNIEKYNFAYLIKNFLHEQGLLIRLLQITLLNEAKFKNIYITPLKMLLTKIYGKKVSFNLITLKHYYLNSDIYIQILALKTKNKKNSLLKVINTSLNSIEMPYNRLLAYLGNNKIVKISPQNLFLSSIKNSNLDKLNTILNKHFTYNINKQIINFVYKHLDKKNISIKDNVNNNYLTIYKKDNVNNIILNGLNYKTVNGLKIEASGRLSKRLIASRAVFKIKNKGAIKNIDSSYKGLSTLILKGNSKSNIQFTQDSSKTRIGAFGLKGWISSF